MLSYRAELLSLTRSTQTHSVRESWLADVTTECLYIQMGSNVTRSAPAFRTEDKMAKLIML